MVVFRRQRIALFVLCLCCAAAPAAKAQDLAEIFDAVVGIEATIPSDARTAGTLGTERAGSGVVIDDNGLVLTIGYLILEADQVALTTAGGNTVAADIIAYDYDTGFGLLRALQPLDAKPIRLGRSDDLRIDEHALVLSRGAAPSAQGVIVAERRRFAGYWEYLLEDAIFTLPPHREYGGAALIGADGTLRGIGSLFVGDVYGGDDGAPGNMFVPVDALKPVLADLLTQGRSASPPKPWLGIFAEEDRGHLFVVRVAGAGPAAEAGIEADDIILRVGEVAVPTLADFYLAVWALGEAGVDVPLTVLRGVALHDVTIGSRDRYTYLRLRSSY
ncbi:MAG: serine protease [Alphaproteobacteria bacterium]|nr:serine protease [Alphaproteobacteria bacterium]